MLEVDERCQEMLSSEHDTDTALMKAQSHGYQQICTGPKSAQIGRGPQATVAKELLAVGVCWRGGTHFSSREQPLTRSKDPIDKSAHASSYNQTQ